MSFPGVASIDAVAAFLLQTLRRHWCQGMQDDADYAELRQILLDDLSDIKEDLSVLRDADRNVACMRFVRGVDLMVRQSLKEVHKRKTTPHTVFGAETKAASGDDVDGASDDTTWREDLTAALDSAEQGYHRVKTTEEKIMCFEIMCSCFLLLRPPESALYSILDSIRVLLSEKVIDIALQGLRKAVVSGSPLSLEHCELLELCLSRLCGIVAACQRMDTFTREFCNSFRAVFRNNEAIKEATEPAIFPRWNDLQVYKYSAKRRVAVVTAHAVVPVVPVLSAVGTVMSAGRYRPKNAGIRSFDTILLKDRRKEKEQGGASLFEFRWALLDLVHASTSGTHQLGNVSLTLDSNASSWNVVAAPADKTPSESAVSAPVSIAST